MALLFGAELTKNALLHMFFLTILPTGLYLEFGLDIYDRFKLDLT